MIEKADERRKWGLAPSQAQAVFRSPSLAPPRTGSLDRLIIDYEQSLFPSLVRRANQKTTVRKINKAPRVNWKRAEARALISFRSRDGLNRENRYRSYSTPIRAVFVNAMRTYFDRFKLDAFLASEGLYLRLKKVIEVCVHRYHD